MSRTGTYYLGRVLKMGRLNQEMLQKALLDPVAVLHRGKAWTFINIEEHKDNQHHFIFGRLSKYTPEGQVKVVDSSKREEIQRPEPNLSVASSPFVYIPSCSGIAFLRVSNQIEQTTFQDRFARIVTETYQNFFVDCEIDMVSDLRSFALKLSKLDGIYSISARISPPNPLFGHLWRPLKEYLEARNTDRMRLHEESIEDGPLVTSLPEYVTAAANQDEEHAYEPDEELPIGDAAILMAADGYGTGIVGGKDDGKWVTINTSETVRNFTFDKDPDPYELYETAMKIFTDIEMNRHMRH